MIEVKPIQSGFVADIDGVDVSHLTEDEFEQIYAAWLHYGVLRIREQRIDQTQLQSFSARFGPLEEAPLVAYPRRTKRK